MSQCDIILSHLRQYGSITAAEAMQDYGIYRLAARIADLISRGHKIISKTEEHKNRFGKKVRYARYYIVNDQGGVPKSE